MAIPTVDQIRIRTRGGDAIEFNPDAVREEVIPMTPTEALDNGRANNIPDNYPNGPTIVGGWVWIEPTYPFVDEILEAYRNGTYSGGKEEVAAPGVRLRAFGTAIPRYEWVNNVATEVNIPPSQKTVVFSNTVTIVNNKVTMTVQATIQVIISPATTPSQTLRKENLITINTTPVNVNISDPLITSAYSFLESAINNYVDEDRQLKTLLNYGEDRQSVALAYRYGTIDTNNVSRIQLKLLQPVPDEISTNSTVFLSREVSKTVIDKLRVRFAPELDATPYLRPKNLKVSANIDSGKSLRNVTLNTLSLQSGSVGLIDPVNNKTFEDQIFRQWYSYDFNSSELNIDFTDYNNFIFYSSAAMRLAAFQEKLYQLQTLETKRKQFLTTYTANTASVGLLYLQDQSATFAKQQEDIIRGFDRYEQYLYSTPSGSNSPYSASAYYADDAQEYNSLAYWPKSGSALWPVDSSVVENWYTSQSLIAQRFDEFNENNLINTIPTHIREDENSDAYITFISMVGHFFDTIKPFADQFPQIYNRDLNPNMGVSKDLVNEIAQSFGFTLPTLNSIYNLADNIIGTVDEIPRRDMTAEIYKRLLHNLPFFAKAKGTKTALETLLKTFGISSQLVSVKETGTPTTSSYHVYEEYTNGIDFDETKPLYIRIPVSASARNPTTLQFSCVPTKNKTMTLLTGDSKWALNVVTHPTISTLGRIEITSGSTQTKILSSSYQEIFDELINVTVQTYAAVSSLYVTQVDGEDLVFNSVSSNSSIFPTLWDSTQYVYIGGAGPLVSSSYEGTFDEIRLWNDSLSEEVILNTAYDPGSNAGDTYSSAADNLLVQLSFNNVNTASFASSSIANESPYKNISDTPSLESLYIFNASGSDIIRYNRTIRQDTILAGSSTYLTNKIKIAPPPIFINTSVGGNRLYRTKSIVTAQTKQLQSGRNKVIMSMNPTDIVNQNIIRNLGLENINAILGSPTSLYTQFDKSLATLKNHYQKYHYVDVNTNKFIRIVSDLMSVLDQVVDYFIPSKATIFTGIIIEPNVLEQVKIPPVKTMRVYGKGAKKTTNAANSLTGSKADYGATFNVEDTIDVLTNTTVEGNYQTHQIQPIITNAPIIEGITTYYTSSLQQPTVIPTASYSKLSSVVEVHDAIFGEVNQYGATTQYKNNTAGTLSNIQTIRWQKFNTASYESLTVGIPVDVIKIVTASTNYFVPPSITEIVNTTGLYQTYNTRHEGYNLNTSSATVSRPPIINMGLDTMNKIPYNDVNYGSVGAEPYNRVYSRKLFTSELETPRFGGNKSIHVPALYDISPSTDFKDVGVTTYFDDEYGIYYYPQNNKTPIYNRLLNLPWNETTQQFVGITTWSFGAGYNIYDVVYQAVDDTHTQLTQETIKSSIGGNGKYYVFKTRASYRPPTDGTAFYLENIPSYVPPAVDNVNWELLKFTPTQKLLAKRIVFDTYTIPDPASNNFKTTTISVDKIIDIPDRYIESFNIPSIAANTYITGELLLQNIATLFALQTNTTGLRIRFYRSSAARNADVSRTLETLPVGSHGVLIDTLITNISTVEITNPIPTLVSDEFPLSGKIFYTIDNTESSTKLGINLLLYYFAIQIQPRIPYGYLRKHYRFFRDNSTATKRRNYVGCKNTIDTTIDGLPPIQVFLSEGTDLIISPTQTAEEIITGGGGVLDAR
jgi:hypothetical protein